MVVLPGNHPHVILVTFQRFTAPRIHCPRNLSLTCVTNPLTVRHKLDSVKTFSSLFSRFAPTSFISLYHMAGSVKGQDELNPALLLVTRAGKMVLSCPLRITCCVAQEDRALFPYNYNKSFIDQACLVKMTGYWLFCTLMDPNSISLNHKNTQKKNLANIQPS